MASIFDNQLMSQNDLDRLAELENAWKSTSDKNLKAQLHNKAESIRQSYGYSGGSSGSEYNVLDNGTTAASSAAKAYESALQSSEQNRQSVFAQQQATAEQQGKSRLRQAYIKNMRDSLGLDQNLKAQGVSGGLSESTKAAYDNSYKNLRDSIDSDTQSAKMEIAKLAAASAYNSGADIAKMQYDSATDRADRMTEAEKTKYDRDFQNQQFEYQKQQDGAKNDLQNRQFDYEQQKDALNREYQQKQDELELQYKMASTASNQQLAAQKLSNTQNQQEVSKVLTLLKSGYYSPEFDDILGFGSDELKKVASGDNNMASVALKMLSNGIYDDSFPEILGYSEDILKQYAESVKLGF